MIIKKSDFSPDGGQAGAAYYTYYEIESLASGLEGWGLYMPHAEDPVYWSEDEENGLVTLFYKNISLEIPNEEVTVRNFIAYVKSKHAPGRRYLGLDAVSAQRYK